MSEIKAEWFGITEVTSLPVGAGLYAWYAVPVAGPQDVASSSALGGKLASHTRTFRHPPMELDVRWHLGARWSGEIAETGIADLAKLIEELSADTRTGPGAELHQVLHHADHRPRLAELLLHAAPRLTAPLYVGVAKGLRRRGMDHLRDYEKARAAMDVGDDPIAVIGDRLGTRLAAAKIPPEALRITPHPVSSLDGLTNVEWRRIAAAAEFVVNRWQRPLFGKR